MQGNSKFGLKMHAGKTKLLIEVVDIHESEKYLGCTLSMSDIHGKELKHRMAASWSTFFRFKEALCNRDLLIETRLKFFDAVVTPCAAWLQLLGADCGHGATTSEHTTPHVEKYGAGRAPTRGDVARLHPQSHVHKRKPCSKAWQH